MFFSFQPTFDEANYKNIDDQVNNLNLQNINKTMFQGQFFVMSLSHNSENLDGEQIDCMTG